eukprot:1161032-Pelagomonas_calceolata.AAC.7
MRCNLSLPQHPTAGNNLLFTHEVVFKATKNPQFIKEMKRMKHILIGGLECCHMGVVCCAYQASSLPDNWKQHTPCSVCFLLEAPSTASICKIEHLPKWNCVSKEGSEMVI